MTAHTLLSAAGRNRRPLSRSLLRSHSKKSRTPERFHSLRSTFSRIPSNQRHRRAPVSQRLPKLFDGSSLVLSPVRHSIVYFQKKTLASTKRDHLGMSDYSNIAMVLQAFRHSGLPPKDPIVRRRQNGACFLPFAPIGIEARWNRTKEKSPMLRTILIVIIVLLLLGSLPTWPYSAGWGYYPSGGLGLILIILVILILADRL